MSAPAEPKISIIIPTRDRPEDLRRCLEILQPQIEDGDAVEVLVCDDGSEHPHPLANTYPAVRWIPGPRNGPGANRNVGARAARGEWLVFLDDDCEPEPGLLAAYEAEITSDPKALLAGPVLRSDAKKDSLLWEAPHNPAAHDLPPSCNFALPRATYLAAGGFDERFRYSFEDMEFFSRLSLREVPAQFVPGAVVHHPSRPLPPASQLARRWEARVISCLDLGATPLQILWRLPRHVFLVILSRFRGRPLNRETLRAAGHFLGEFFITLLRLPGWLARYRRAPRSSFWTQQVAEGKGPPGFGL